MTFKDHIQLETLIFIRNESDTFIDTMNEFGHCVTNKEDDVYIFDKMKQLNQLKENYSILLDALNDKMVECYGN